MFPQFTVCCFLWNVYLSKGSYTVFLRRTSQEIVMQINQTGTVLKSELVWLPSWLYPKSKKELQFFKVGWGGKKILETSDRKFKEEQVI